VNRRIAASAAAAAVLVGMALVVVPQHGWSAARVGAVAVAVTAGGLVLLAVAPAVHREPPASELDRRASAGAPPLDPHGLRDARRDLGRPAAAGSVPRPVHDRLVGAAAVRFQHLGIDPETGRGRGAVATLVRSATVQLLDTVPPPGSAPAPRRVAEVVHRTLDELDALARHPGASHGRS
jgi:hypothetical protein